MYINNNYYLINIFLIKSTTILCGITTQEVYIRSATQTILTKFIIEHLDVSFKQRFYNELKI